MLYDEEGRAYVEPPLLPQEQHVFNVVKDYQRMYHENAKVLKDNNRLRESLRKLNGERNYFQNEAKERLEVIRHCINHMKKHNIEPSPYLSAWLKRKNIK